MVKNQSRNRSNKEADCPIIDKLIERRIELNLSIAEVSNLSGYGTTTINQWESERQSPRLSALIDWAQSLNMELLIFDKDL